MLTVRGRSRSLLLWLLFGFILLAGAALRVYLLPMAPIWGDEVYTWHLTQLPVGEMIRVTANDVHPPIYYICCRLLYLAIGNVWAIRIVSLVASLISLALAMRVAWRIAEIRAAPVSGRTRLAIYTGAALAINPFFLIMSTEGRNYSLGILFLLVMILGAIPQFSPVFKATKHQLAGIFIYFFAALASIYTHNLFLFVVFTSGIILMGYHVMNRNWRGFFFHAGLHFGLFLLFLPWFFVTLRQSNEMRVALEWMNMPRPTDIKNVYFMYLPFGIIHSYYRNMPAGMMNFLGAFFSIVILFGAFQMRRAHGFAMTGQRSPAIGVGASRLLYLVGLTVLPIALEYIVTHYYTRVFYPLRYTVFQLPTFILILAWGFACLRPAWLSTLLFGIYLGLLMPYTTRLIAGPINSETEAMVELAAHYLEDGEPLYRVMGPHWELNEIEFYRRKYIPEHQVHYLGDFLEGADIENPEQLPNRLLVHDWHQAHFDKHAREGPTMLHLLKSQAKGRLLRTSTLPEEAVAGLYVFTDIPWEKMLRDYRDYHENYKDLRPLSWEVILRADNTNFKEEHGWSGVHVDGAGNPRWMENGDSYFTLRPVSDPETFEAGNYWAYASYWLNDEVPEDKRYLSYKINNQLSKRIFIPNQFSVGIAPVNLPFSKAEHPFRWDFLYDPWRPREVYDSDDDRKLGVMLFWLALLKNARILPEYYAEPPVYSWHPATNAELEPTILNRENESIEATFDLLEWYLPPQWIEADPPVPVLDILLYAQWEAATARDQNAMLRADEKVASRERLMVSAQDSPAVPLSPWPITQREIAELKEPHLPTELLNPENPFDYVFMLPAVFNNREKGGPVAAITVKIEVPEATGRWIIKGIDVMRPHQSIEPQRILAGTR